jgi:hypothetical protein
VLNSCPWPKAQSLEILRLAFREAFELYKKEVATTETLIAHFPKPPGGDDLRRLLLQQSKEREAFEHYQRSRQAYVNRALEEMSGKPKKQAASMHD